MNRCRSVLGPALVVLVVAALAACGGSDEGSSVGPVSESPTAAGVDDAEFPMTIDHMLGSIELDRPPERIVALGAADADIALALGARPVAVVAASNGDGLPSPWLRDQVDLEGVEVLPPLESGQVSIESVLALRPDLVLATTAFGTVEAYQQMEAAGVPILVADEGYFEDSWQELTRLIGRALGRSTAAETLVAETEATVEEFADAHPNLDGASVVIALDRGAGDGFNVLTEPENSSVQFFSALGMELPVQLLGATGLSRTAGGIQISGERVDLLDADAVFVAGATGTSADPATNPLLEQLSAVRNGTFLPWPTEVAAGVRVPSPLSIPYVLEHIEPTLARVGQG